MTNINRLKLTWNVPITLPGAIGNTRVSQIDQVANDFKQTLKVVGIHCIGMAPTVTAASKYIIRFGITSNPNQFATNLLYEWQMYFDNVTNTVTAVDSFIGNHKDTMFEIKQWDTELVERANLGTVVSGSQKGELYLVAQIKNLAATASVIQPQVFITMYYRF